MISGNVGPNAFEVLSASGIETMTGASGTVRNALELYKSGSLQSAAGATVSSHAGMAGMGSGQDAPGQASMTKEQKISMLEDELEQASLQLAQIKKKLEDMKK